MNKPPRIRPKPIFVNAQGVPYERPNRDNYPGGIEGDIEYMRARHAWKQRITNDANQAFDTAFRKALKRKITP